MIIDRFIKKSNVITDGNIPDRAVLTEKVLNVIYENFQNKGKSFKVTFAELFKQLNISNQTENKKRVKESLLILSQSLELKNFTRKDGRRVEWYVGSFMKATIFSDTRDFININIDEDTLFAIEQLNQYTVIDINISNKFKTKYGIVLWQMYLRYKNQNRSGVAKNWTYQAFSLDDLNRKFATNYKHNSKMLEGINRGLKEIKKITDKEITISFDKEKNKFVFYWQKEKKIPKYLKSEKSFIAYIREKYIANMETKEFPTIYVSKENMELKVNFKGYLYGVKDGETVDFDKDQAHTIWSQLYQKAKEGREF